MPRLLSDLVETSLASQALAFFRKGLDDFNSDCVPVVLASHIARGVITGELQVERVNSERLEPYRLQDGDVLVAPTRAAVRAAVVTAEHDGALAGSNTFVLREFGGTEPAYVAAVLNSPIFGKQFLGKEGANLALSELRSARIPQHSAEFRTEIAALYRWATETLLAALDEYDLQQKIVDELLSYGDGRE